MAIRKAEVSAEISTRMCAHMNDDHAVTIHAMVLSNLSNQEAARCKVQNAKMTCVSLKGYSISYVLCDGDACAMKEITIPFDPPLNSSGEARSRLIEDHHRAFAPKFSWLITDPLIRILFGACILLGMGTAVGQEELAKRVDDIPLANAIVAATFGTSARFAAIVVGSWYFSLAAHTLEACYTAYLCKMTLKMKTGSTLAWFVLNVCTGFPIMNKIKDFVDVDTYSRPNQKNR
mmetsp:Transcript_53833/g.114367  ORF Transcript_53833/g.114367 Transcript_53833/m.114367 type:complete len:233 (+) Transcript_53833:110-808(+)